MPSPPGYAVLEAPNSLEINALKQPVVTVLEPENIARETPFSDDREHIAVRDREPLEAPAETEKPELDSRISRGALMSARPLVDINPAPEYPRLARERGLEGIVRLEVQVEQDGHPGEVRIEESSGHALLDDSALKAVSHWRFSPARSGLLRFSSKIIVPIQFTLLKH